MTIACFFSNELEQLCRTHNANPLLLLGAIFFSNEMFEYGTVSNQIKYCCDIAVTSRRGGVPKPKKLQFDDGDCCLLLPGFIPFKSLVFAQGSMFRFFIFCIEIVEWLRESMALTLI